MALVTDTMNSKQQIPRTQQLCFEDLLRQSGIEIDSNIVICCRRRFCTLVIQAVLERRSDLARLAYEEAFEISQNEQIIRQFEGYQLRAGHFEPESQRLFCFNGTFAKEYKVLSPTEMRRGSRLLVELSRSACRSPFLIDFEIRTINSKNFMFIPRYVATLKDLNCISLQSGVRLFEQMYSALGVIHQIGMNHMNLKPSNICLNEIGDFVLAGLTQAVAKNEYSESTQVYLPRDFQPRSPLFPAATGYQAVDENDWLMLGMTIAEKVYCLNIINLDPPTTEEIVRILQTDGAFDHLIALMTGVTQG
jgi:hypothetical protein